MLTLAQRVSELQDIGFKLVDSTQVTAETPPPFGFPDVTMVADGSRPGTDFNYGVAFLYRDAPRNDALHFAVPETVSKMQLDQLGQSGAMLLKTKSGVHAGYIFPKSPFVLQGMDKLQSTLEANNIRTVPIPMDYDLFPFFNNPDRHPGVLTPEETVDILSYHLNGNVDAIEMSHEQRNRVFNISEAKPEASPEPEHNRFRPRM